jgi:F-type H+-transporting ATPase subunit delta
VANEAVARRYARALLEIAQEEGALERFEADLARFTDAFEGSEDLRDVLLNPVFEAEARKQIVRDLAGRLDLGPLVANFVCLLVDKRKLRALPDILRAYRDMVDRAAGRVEALLVAATAVDRETASRVEGELAKWTGKRVRLTTKVDPALIGGAVARVGGFVLDGSIRSQLEGLRRRLAKDSVG